MIRKIGLIGWMCLLMQGIAAQTVKTITVSHQTPYTDHLTLSKDARDKDLMVKFIFDEGANTLTVSLISYRSLFVFWDQVRYKPAVWNGKLRPGLLPYVTEGNPDTKIRLSRKFKRSIPLPRKNHVFNRWIYVDGMQPVPMPYKLVNDIIEQKFDIVGKREMVKVTLRDVLLMDQIPTRLGKPEKYEISFSTDLNLQYQVLISRDPCFGMDEEIAAAQNAVASVEKASVAIKNRFGNGVAASKELLDVFEEMKSLFLQQFAPHEGTSTCPNVNQAWEEYNKHVSSIASLECRLGGIDSDGVVVGDGVSARLLLVKARQIDGYVSRWLLTKDVIERRDIIAKCEGVIGEVNELVSLQGIKTDEQRRALNVFREAQQYYKTNCVMP
ncbi:MAG: hypothetical protein J6U14_10770 [Bacteroidaceae bacterium]|nr:hypothetical protein [Bacteroidaceae bacterium]